MEETSDSSEASDSSDDDKYSSDCEDDANSSDTDADANDSSSNSSSSSSSESESSSASDSDSSADMPKSENQGNTKSKTAKQEKKYQQWYQQNKSKTQIHRLRDSNLKPYYDPFDLHFHDAKSGTQSDIKSQSDKKLRSSVFYNFSSDNRRTSDSDLVSKSDTASLKQSNRASHDILSQLHSYSGITLDRSPSNQQWQFGSHQDKDNNNNNTMVMLGVGLTSTMILCLCCCGCIVCTIFTICAFEKPFRQNSEFCDQSIYRGIFGQGELWIIDQSQNYDNQDFSNTNTNSNGDYYYQQSISDRERDGDYHLSKTKEKSQTDQNLNNPFNIGNGTLNANGSGPGPGYYQDNSGLSNQSQQFNTQNNYSNFNDLNLKTSQKIVQKGLEQVRQKSQYSSHSGAGTIGLLKNKQRKSMESVKDVDPTPGTGQDLPANGGKAQGGTILLTKTKTNSKTPLTKQRSVSSEKSKKSKKDNINEPVTVNDINNSKNKLDNDRYDRQQQQQWYQQYQGQSSNRNRQSKSSSCCCISCFLSIGGIIGGLGLAIFCGWCIIIPCCPGWDALENMNVPPLCIPCLRIIGWISVCICCYAFIIPLSTFALSELGYGSDLHNKPVLLKNCVHCCFHSDNQFMQCIRLPYHEWTKICHSSGKTFTGCTQMLPPCLKCCHLNHDIFAGPPPEILSDMQNPEDLKDHGETARAYLQDIGEYSYQKEDKVLIVDTEYPIKTQEEADAINIAKAGGSTKVDSNNLTKFNPETQKWINGLNNMKARYISFEATTLGLDKLMHNYKDFAVHNDIAVKLLKYKGLPYNVIKPDDPKAIQYAIENIRDAGGHVRLSSTFQNDNHGQQIINQLKNEVKNAELAEAHVGGGENLPVTSYEDLKAKSDACIKILEANSMGDEVDRTGSRENLGAFIANIYKVSGKVDTAKSIEGTDFANDLYWARHETYWKLWWVQERISLAANLAAAHVATTAAVGTAFATSASASVAGAVGGSVVPGLGTAAGAATLGAIGFGAGLVAGIPAAIAVKSAESAVQEAMNDSVVSNFQFLG